jgi:translocation and assembly module TamB
VNDAVAPAREDSVEQGHWRPRRDWPQRLLREFIALLLALFLLGAGALVLLDTAPGHRFIVDRIAEIESKSGLKVRIGRIDGSIFGKSRLRDVAIAGAVRKTPR